MLPLLALVFLVVPIAEIYVIIQVGQVIGGGWTVLLLLAGAVLGSWLVKREGSRAYRRFRAALTQGRAPGPEVADGALVLVGAALLVAPGFLTDLLGLVLLLPPTRHMVRRALLRFAARRAGRLVEGGLAPSAPSAASAPSAGRRPPSEGARGVGGVIDGQVIDAQVIDRDR